MSVWRLTQCSSQYGLAEALEQQHCLISHPRISPSEDAMLAFLNWFKFFWQYTSVASIKAMQLLMVHDVCLSPTATEQKTCSSPSAPEFSRRWSVDHGKRCTSYLTRPNSIGLKKIPVSHSSEKFNFTLPIFQNFLSLVICTIAVEKIVSWLCYQTILCNMFAVND